MKMEAKEYEQEIERLESVIKLKEDEIDDLSEKVEEAEVRIEELEAEMEQLKENSYKICGKEVSIHCDNIQYQALFELLAEQSKKFKNVHDLFGAIAHRL